MTAPVLEGLTTARLFVALDADETPTVWMDIPGAPIALLRDTDLPIYGRQVFWDHITTGLLNLIDREGDLIEDLYGCNCDQGYTCSVAECQMEQKLETRVWLQRYRSMVAAGADPSKPYVDDPWSTAGSSKVVGF